MHIYSTELLGCESCGEVHIEGRIILNIFLFPLKDELNQLTLSSLGIFNDINVCVHSIDCSL